MFSFDAEHCCQSPVVISFSFNSCCLHLRAWIFPKSSDVRERWRLILSSWSSLGLYGNNPKHRDCSHAQTSPCPSLSPHPSPFLFDFFPTCAGDVQLKSSCNLKQQDYRTTLPYLAVLFCVPFFFFKVITIIFVCCARALWHSMHMGKENHLTEVREISFLLQCFNFLFILCLFVCFWVFICEFLLHF